MMISGGQAWMSPSGLAQLKAKMREQHGELAAARKRRLLIVPSVIEQQLGIAQLRQIKVGQRVRADGSEGTVDLVLSGEDEGMVVVTVDSGPLAGAACVVKGALLEDAA
jgi:hypothetical protein